MGRTICSPLVRLRLVELGEFSGERIGLGGRQERRCRLSISQHWNFADHDNFNADQLWVHYRPTGKKNLLGRRVR